MQSFKKITAFMLTAIMMLTCLTSGLITAYNTPRVVNAESAAVYVTNRVQDGDAYKYSISMSDSFDGVVIIAQYDIDGNLLDFKSYHTPAADFDVVTYPQAKTVKLMHWDGFDDVNPLDDVQIEYEPEFLSNVTVQSVSSYQNDGKNNVFPGENVLDGIIEGYCKDKTNILSQWVAQDSSVPQYIVLDFGEVCDFSELEIWWNTMHSGGKDERYASYQIYVSNDAQSYKLALDRSSNTTPYHTHDILPYGTRGRYLKINVTKMSAGWVAMYEIKAYGHNLSGVQINPDEPDEPFEPSTPKQYIHMSVDDVINCMKDIVNKQNTYTSIFDNATFALFKEMHDKYGAVVTLNTFNEDSSFDISSLPSKYAEEVSENSYWLKFAFHAKDKNQYTYASDNVDGIKADYNKFVNAMKTFSGGDTNVIDRVTRLGFFEGTKANLLALRECELGPVAFTTADNNDTRLSYYFDNSMRDKVNSAGFWYDEDTGILFLRSQRRMEHVSSNLDVAFANILKYPDAKVIEIFTHEQYIKSNVLEEYFKWAYENGYGFDFAQNQYQDILASVLPVPDFTYTADYTDGNVSDWVNRNGGFSLLTTDESDNYYGAKNTSETRGAYLLLNSEVDNITSYTMEFDAKLNAGQTDNSQIALGSADYFTYPTSRIGSGEDEYDAKRSNYDLGFEKHYLFLLSSTESNNWILNPNSDNVNITLPDNRFIHFTVIGSRKNVTLLINDGNRLLYSGKITPDTSYPKPQMLYLRAGKSDSDIGIDNVKFNAYYGALPLTAYKTDDSINISVAPFDTGSIHAELYDKNGNLLDTSFANADGTAVTLKLISPSESETYIKLYKKPYDTTGMIINTDEISLPESLIMNDMRYAYYDAKESLDGLETYSERLPYRYHIPQSYDDDSQYPVVVYLHGAGACGEDNKGQIRNDRHFVDTLLSEKYLNNPDTQCIIIAPQVRDKYINRSWSAGSYNYNDVQQYQYVGLVHDAIEDIKSRYSVDADRIYILGQSMGGYGCWHIAATYPEMFAAAVGLCGAGPVDSNGAGKMAAQNMAAWAFYGSADTTVPPSGSIEMINALNSFGATNANITELTGMGHNIEKEVFTGINTAGIYQWLFEQSKAKNVSSANN